MIFNSYILYFLLFLLNIFLNSFSEIDKDNKLNNKFPRLEFEVNTGLFWIAQLKANINIFDNIYLKYRLSGSFLTKENAIIVGFQENKGLRYKGQFGLGFSWGKIDPFVPGGPDENDTTEHWKTISIDSDIIYYLIKIKIINIGFNFGFNFIIDRRRTLPSINTGIIIGIF